jgi:two-component system cell cycle sensor histidine kinase/response regulator CckA
MDAQTIETPETAAGEFFAAEELAGVETILLVEDDAFVRDVTGEVLRSAGYAVLTAKNAAEATGVYSARGGVVDLLLSDVVLPGENGRALARRLRRKNPELKVLLVTGYAEQMGLQGVQAPEEEKEKAQEGDEVECLAKPFSTEVLLRRVRQILGHAGSQMGTGDLLTPACGSA